MPDQREEKWRPYNVFDNDWRSVVLCDLCWQARGADSRRPIAVQIHIALQSPREDGFPKTEENQRLYRFQDFISEKLANEIDALLVATRVGRGKKILLYYANQEPPASLDLRSTDDQYQWHVQNIHSSHDPAWSVYRRDFFPNDEQLCWIGDSDVYDNIQRHGDDGTQPRKIEHWAFFRSSDIREKFARWCIEAGFAVESRYELDDDSPNRYCLNFSHHGLPHPNEMAPYTWPATRMAKELGGNYDGWESIVLNDAPPEPHRNRLLQRLLDLFKLRRGG